MLSASEARAALRPLGYRLSPYRGGFIILDGMLNYLDVDESGGPRTFTLEEVSKLISELKAPGMHGEERRALPRKRSLEQAKVLLPDWKVIDCVVRDISDSGARLEFAKEPRLPGRFRLLILSQSLVVAVELEWQQGDVAGVRFARGPEKASPTL
jgi:hypothetical protein